MPGPLRSPELARKARERLPDIAVLFTSGYTENAIVHGGRLDDGVELLSKPYSREALARKIQFVLRNQQQRSVAQTAPRPAEPRASEARADAPTDGLRILLVEDDTLIRASTADMLTDLGHSVEEAADGATGLDALEKHDFDVLVTDLSLPGMSGEEFAAAATERRPDLRVVFATGYAGPSASSRGGRLQSAVVLQKPYDVKSMAAALKAAFSGS